MTVREKIMRRLEFNRKILNILHEMLGNNEFLRFGQALHILGIDDKDWFYTESADMYEIMEKNYKKHMQQSKEIEDYEFLP